MRIRNRNQRGFTLIEMVIGVAVTGLVVAAASGAVIQVIQSTHTSAHMVALRQVQTAGYWVSKDSLQAQTVTTGADAGFPLTLAWIDWEGNSHSITYTLEPMDDLYKLQRSEGATNTIVGQYLTDNTICEPVDHVLAPDEVLTFKVTASVTGARGLQTETRTYEIKPRPDPIP